MTEQVEEKTPEPQGTPMFVCGSQITNDGDIQPGLFTVFPLTTDPDDVAQQLVLKVLTDAAEMGLTHGNGQAAMWGVWTWEEWAEIEVDPLVKLNALISAITASHLAVSMRHSNKIEAINAVAWLPPKN